MLDSTERSDYSSGSGWLLICRNTHCKRKSGNTFSQPWIENNKPQPRCVGHVLCRHMAGHEYLCVIECVCACVRVYAWACVWKCSDCAAWVHLWKCLSKYLCFRFDMYKRPNIDVWDGGGAHTLLRAGRWMREARHRTTCSTDRCLLHSMSFFMGLFFSHVLMVDGSAGCRVPLTSTHMPLHQE